MKKYVITAGPGNGKTTVIEILASRGFTVVQEAARLIIEEERLKDSDILPWKNLEKFQEKLAIRQLDLESFVKGEVVFLDRGIVDGYAYCKIGNIPSPQLILDKARNRYDKVFLLDPLNLYKKDEVRLEDAELAKKIHDTIALAYKEFGYITISVPTLPPEQRADFIVQNL